MMIGRRLATDTSMLRMPKTRPRTACGISAWSSVWAGIAVNAYPMPATKAMTTTTVSTLT